MGHRAAPAIGDAHTIPTTAMGTLTASDNVRTVPAIARSLRSVRAMTSYTPMACTTWAMLTSATASVTSPRSVSVRKAGECHRDRHLASLAHHVHEGQPDHSLTCTAGEGVLRSGHCKTIAMSRSGSGNAAIAQRMSPENSF